jgi:hypothetical protein
LVLGGKAVGLESEDAALEAGVAPAVGTRWFRTAGGIPPAMFGQSAKPLLGWYLSFAEREEIALLRAQGSAIQILRSGAYLGIAGGGDGESSG